GQPVVQFDGTEDSFFFGSITGIRTIFWVIKEDADATVNWRSLLSGTDGPADQNFHRGPTQFFWSPVWAAPEVHSGMTYINGAGVGNGQSTTVPTTLSIVHLETTGDTQADQLGIDRALNDRAWDGDIAEVMIYDRALTAEEINEIGYYLQEKYGIDTTFTDPSLPIGMNDGSVWSENFAGVWHLTDPAASNQFTDSSTAANHGAGNGTTTLPGQIGDAQDWEGDDYIRIPRAAVAGLTDEVTVSLWQFGDAALQPQADYLFRADNANTIRELSVLMPWSNGQIYWDAGGGNAAFDRINRLATESDYEGAWHYWTFTKNRLAGTLNIYRNSQLWHSGTGHNRSMAGITTDLILGANTSGAQNYDGLIDEFRVASVE
ncbi:MAG: LamG-like jellyroll fold domain-containing protein, partial [Verrucomicrobiota bacterium]